MSGLATDISLTAALICWRWEMQS